MGYGRRELIWAKPFADALVSDPKFRSWILLKTKFATSAEGARVLNDEMLALRSDGTRYWWRSHFQEACRCFGCSGHETDLLAIFENKDRARFALHVEVKHPGDKFKKPDQAPAYPERAECWVRSTPRPVLAHSDATTMLLCSKAKLSEFRPHLSHFASIITFEEIARAFPRATAHAGS